jgi:hypothetical protein
VGSQSTWPPRHHTQRAKLNLRHRPQSGRGGGPRRRICWHRETAVHADGLRGAGSWRGGPPGRGQNWCSLFAAGIVRLFCKVNPVGGVLGDGADAVGAGGLAPYAWI